MNNLAALTNRNEGSALKFKGFVRNAGGRPDFWRNAKKEIPMEFKQIMYDQYYSRDTLYVYCDCSMDIEQRMMSIACSYVQNGFVLVEDSLIYPPDDCVGKNVYGELQAVLFGLLHFEKQLYRFSENMVIYSGIAHITDIINLKSTFKKSTSLTNLQLELLQTFNQKQLEYPHINLSVEYLPVKMRAYNPFAKSAHNAARKLLQK